MQLQWGQYMWHMHTSPSQSAYSPRGRYVMTAVCAAARHFHTYGPLAWNNPLIKGFLYYQPFSPLPKPPPLTPHLFLIHLKEFPLLSRAITVPQSLYRNPPTHTQTHTLIPHVHSDCGPWCKCGRVGHFSAAVECMSFLSPVAAKGWERVGGGTSNCIHVLQLGPDQTLNTIL